MGNTRKLPPIRLTPLVIGAINGELYYQSTLHGSGRADAREHGVEGQLVTLKVYTDEALVAWAKNPGDSSALGALRKVAAIAVRALVQYGCPLRETREVRPKYTPEEIIALHEANQRQFMATLDEYLHTADGRLTIATKLLEASKAAGDWNKYATVPTDNGADENGYLSR